MATIFKNPWANNQWASEEEQEKTLEQEWVELDKEHKEKSKDDIYRKKIEDDLLFYTCHAGWIDMTHFTGLSTSPIAGARYLWDQMLYEEKCKKSFNGNGFKVIGYIYAVLYGIRFGKRIEYFVEYGLSIEKKEEVALAIFQEVSIEFERLQAAGGIIGKGDSSFEPADLISNLLSFYHVVKGYFDYWIFEVCERLTKEQSMKIYEQYPGTFTEKKYKNKKFIPKYFPNNYCKGGSFPKDFQVIKPAQKGVNFRNWNIYIDEEYKNIQISF